VVPFKNQNMFGLNFLTLFRSYEIVKQINHGYYRCEYFHFVEMNEGNFDFSPPSHFADIKEVILA
jgi:hypothetical protein